MAIVKDFLEGIPKLIYDPDHAFQFSNLGGYNPMKPGVADDGLSTPSDMENFLRNTPIINALFGQKIADQMSSDRWTKDYYTLTGLSPKDNYYPHLNNLQTGGSGAMAVYSALKGTMSSLTGSTSPTPYAMDDQSSDKMKKIYG